MTKIAKIELDKYYTSKELAEYCVNKTKEIIGEENITEWLEPSAGCGNFLDFLGDNYKAYDIAPEDNRIVKQDYLELDLEYKKGRCVIGNPPYGRCLNLAQKFFKKSIKIGDYIAFILPISQLDNIKSFYEFDLIYSEDLNIKNYSGINLHCCFNIYKKPNGFLNKKKNIKLKDIKIIRQDSKAYNDSNFDIRMCYWGNGSAGKILSNGENYSAEYKVIIHNEKLKDRIKYVLNNVNWSKELNKIAMLKIQQFHIHELLKREIPEIE